MRAILFFLFLLIMSIVPAFADERDAGTRYHDAYVLEVVEGKIADAAKAYLALMEDEQAPTRFRLESRFRFAVCAVLLGRADEARAQLDELLRTPDLPDAVRARAETYRKSMSGIGIGSELEKKLQALVFELAKTNEALPPEYREFEVIGPTALPFLRKLLLHQDKELRRHAFRILLRMREPDMLKHWEPTMRADGWTWKDMQDYFGDVEGSREVFEARVLSLGEPALRSAGNIPSWNEVSPSFLTAFVKQGGNKRSAAKWAARVESDETDALLTALARDEDVAVRAGALQAIARFPSAHKRPFAPALFPDAVAVVVGSVRHNDIELDRWAEFVSADALIGGLSQIAEGGRDAARRLSVHWVGLSARLANHKLNAAQLARYVATLKRRITQLHGTGTAVFVMNWARPQLRAAPKHVAVEFATWLFTSGWERDHRWLTAFKPAQHPREVDMSLAAARVAPVDRRWKLLSRVPLRSVQGADDPLLQSFLDIAKKLPASDLRNAGFHVTHETRTLDAPARAAIFERVITVAGGMDQPTRDQLLRGASLLSFVGFAQVGVKLAAAHWDSFSPQVRREILSRATSASRDDKASAEDRRALIDFVRAHRDELQGSSLTTVARAGESILTYEEWLPLASWHNFTGAGQTTLTRAIDAIPQARADEAAAKLAETRPLTKSIISFAMNQTSTRREYADKFLAMKDRDVRAFAIQRLSSSGSPASPESLESALTVMLGETDPDWGSIHLAVQKLTRVRPSVRLIPAVEGLLTSETRSIVLGGIAAARSLGDESVIPSLKKLLHSMDQEVRRAAKEGIDEIDALVRLRGEK